MEKTNIIKQNIIRENNVKNIIELLSDQPYSCLEISNKIELSDVGVNKIIKQLLSFDLVKRVDYDEDKKKIGGQHIRYAVNEKVGVYVCLDLTEYYDNAFIYDFSGKIIKTLKLEISHIAEKSEIENVIKTLKSHLELLLVEYKNILGVGIAVPGQINKNTNEFIETSRFKMFKDDELYKMFEKEFKTQIIIRHNVHMMAIGESYKGKLASDYDIATHIYSGMGLAASVMVEGKCISGWNGYAGEIGGNKILPFSTLSRHCSIGRILYKARETYPDLTVDGLFDLYVKDESFHSTVNESATIMAMFMNNVTNLLGCNLFIISGLILRFGDEYLNIIREFLDKYAPIKVSVQKSSLENAAIIGAVKLLKDFAIIDYYRKAVQNSV